MARKTQRKLFRFMRKHDEAITILNLILTILLGILPFLIEERLEVFQRIRHIELPTLTEYEINPSVELRFGISSSVFITIERANGTVEHFQAH
jgi:hypothetical protein